MATTDEFREHHIDMPDGVTLYVREYGPSRDTRPTILCLHGLTRNSADFHGLARHLARRYRVIAPDMRGRGHSQYDPQWQRYRPETYRDDVVHLLGALGLKRVAIVGTSLGGLIAMLLARARPQMLLAVILNDVGPEIAPEGLQRILTYVGRLPPVADWQEATGQNRGIFEHALPDFDDDEWLAHTRLAYRDDPDGGVCLSADPNIGRALREVGGALEDPWELFRALRPIPTLTMRGELSDILSVEIFDRMQAEHPDMVRATIPNRGHVPMLDEPESLAAIDSFLAGVSPGIG